MKSAFCFLRNFCFWVMIAALAFVATASPALAGGNSNKPITGAFEPVAIGAETVTAVGNKVDYPGMMFYLRPYDLPTTLDLQVTYGPNSYTATGTFKIAAASTNCAQEFGPFYVDHWATSTYWYLSLTTSAAPAASCTVYTRSYQPIKHNY